MEIQADFGFVSRIDERRPDNTRTSYRFEILCRVNYLAQDHVGAPGNFSRLYFLVRLQFELPFSG